MNGRLLRWPPYVVVLVTFVALQVATSLVMYILLEVAVARGTLDAMPRDPSEIDRAIEIAIGPEWKQLALSIAVNAVVMVLIALSAARTGLPHGHVASGLVHRLRLGPPRALDVVVAVLGLLGLTTALDSIVVLLGLHDFGALAEMRDAIAPIEGTQRLLFAALIGIGPGVTEELLFRGYLLNRISASQGWFVGLAVSSIVFGAMHVDPLHALLAMMMGFYLGLCLMRTGSLWVSIAAHGVNNALAALTVEWAPSDGQAALLIPLGLIASGAAVTLLAKRRRRLSSQAVPW